MNVTATLSIAAPPRLGNFLRGDVAAMEAWVTRFDTKRLVFCLAVIAVGAGAFGASVGIWRSPVQALYTAAKLPLIILLTTLGNGLLNGMLAPLLGLNIRFRESLLAILMSFTVASAILGSIAPLILFLVWNTPPLDAHTNRESLAYQTIMLTNVVAIAFAGIVGVARLLSLLKRLSGSEAVATRVLLAWLTGNLLLGAQLAWNLRPFIGSPHLTVQFVRPDAFEGNFYEAVFHSFASFFTSH